MSSLWPWLAVAGAGALHGLNPCTGWALAAACGGRSGDGRQTLCALAPIAAGHAASLGLVAGLVVLGLAGVGWLALPAGALLLAALLLRLSRRTGPRLRARAECAGLALGSFMAATLHGSGMMLVPALVPPCLSNGPAKEITASGSLLLALAAVAVHMAAMLGVMAVVALAAGRVFAAGLLRKARPARAHSAPPRDARLLERLEVPCSRPHRGIACCPCRPRRQRARHRRGPRSRGGARHRQGPHAGRGGCGHRRHPGPHRSTGTRLRGRPEPCRRGRGAGAAVPRASPFWSTTWASSNPSPSRRSPTPTGCASSTSTCSAACAWRACACRR